MKRIGRKPLSLLLALCMMLSLLPAMTIGALAADTTVKVGSESTPAATAYTGTGWSWAPVGNTSGTLTLSGVDLTSAGIYLPCSADLVLEGTNQITGTVTDGDTYTAAIFCTGALTIGGSGILRIAEENCRFGIEAYGVTFNSGEVDVSVNDSSGPVAIDDKSSKLIAVNGGYLSANAVGSGSSAFYGTKLVVNGGYVTASASGSDTSNYKYSRTVWMGSSGDVTVNGGYLEVTAGDYGIMSGRVTNAGGVFKITGCTQNAISGWLYCNDGVTIASSTGAAANSNIYGIAEEKLYDNVDGTLNTTPVNTTDLNSDTRITSTLTGIVIAKSASATQLTATTLDGAYIKTTGDPYYSWSPSGDATVTGGNYVESDYYSCYLDTAHSVTVSGTLVAPAMGSFNVGYNVGANLTVSGNFIALGSTGDVQNYGIYTAGGVTNTGNIVATGNHNAIIEASSFSQTAGSTVVKTGTYNGFVGSGALKTTGDTTVSAGALTVDADYSSDFALLCEGNLNASGTGTITCANAGTYGAKCPGTVTLPAGKIALGSADEYSPLIKVYHWISSAINGCYTTTPLSEEDFPTLAKVVFFSGLSTDPAVAVGTQAGTLTCGTEGSATFTVTPTHFTNTLAAANYTAAWCASDGTAAVAPAGITLSVTNASTLTATATKTAAAGTYCFKLTAASGSETAVSAVVTLTIGKADAADAMKTATATVSTTAKTNTLTLPTLPAGGAYGTPAFDTNTSGLLTGTPSVSNGVLTFDTTAKDNDTTATITVPVTGCTNYKDYTLTVTLTVGTVTSFVTYDANGGKIGSDSTKTIATSGGKADLPTPNPTWTGYTFAGWYTDKTYTTPVTAATEISADTTVYAKWTNTAGKTVRTTLLDFTETGDNPAWKTGCTAPTGESTLWTNTAEGWSYDTASQKLTLSGAAIDCTGVTDSLFAIKLPDSAVIWLDTGTTSTVKAGPYSTGSEDLIAAISAAPASSEASALGALTVLGNGTLDVTSGNDTANKALTTAFYEVTIGDGVSTPTVSAAGGSAASSNTTESAGSLSCGVYIVTMMSGSLTATGGAATGCENQNMSVGVGMLSLNGGRVTAIGGTAAAAAVDGSTARSYGVYQMIAVTRGSAYLTGHTGAMLGSAADLTVSGSTTYHDLNTLTEGACEQKTGSKAYVPYITVGGKKSVPLTASVSAVYDVAVNGIDIKNGGYWKNTDTAETGARGSNTDYNFHYDKTTGVLTLNNADVKSIAADNCNVTLELIGTNQITTEFAGDKETYGLYVNSGDLTVQSTGSGTLTIEPKSGTPLKCGLVVRTGNLFIKSGTINATGSYGGINVYQQFASEGGTGTPDTMGRIVMTGGTVHAKATGDENGYGYAYACDGNFEVSGDSANFTADAVYGIYSDGYRDNGAHYCGTISIQEGHTITDSNGKYTIAGFEEKQTEWKGDFFKNYGLLTCVKGVLTKAQQTAPAYFVYGTGDNEYISGRAVIGQTIALPDISSYRPNTTLNGWYTGENGSGTPVTSSTPITSAMLTKGRLVLYASLTKNGLDKRTTTLDLTSPTVDYATKTGSKTNVPTSSAITDTNEGWAWYPTASTNYDSSKAIDDSNHPANTLILDHADIETDDGDALKVPAGTTIVVKSDSTAAASGSKASAVQGVGALTITGSGRLTAAGTSAAIQCTPLTLNGETIIAPTGGKFIADQGTVVDGDGKTALSVTIGAKIAPYIGGSSTTSSTTSTVVVDGKTTDAGKVTTTTNADGTRNTTVAVDTAKLSAQVAAADKGSSVVVTVPASTGTASAQLVVRDVENLDAKNMPLEIKTGGTTYTIAPNAIDTAKVASELGATDTSKVPLTVTVTPVKQSDVTVSKGEQVSDPVKFEITASYNGKTVSVSTFNSYVSRTLAVPAGVDPNKITTGIRVEDGEQVPTFVSKNADGTYTAKINSLTNSTYVIIYNQASFADTVGKWYDDIVTEMASRTIVNGRTATTFDGGGLITRAEYAAILVRALGIPEGGANSFSDVGGSDWYCGAVSAAVRYGIIKGFADGTFRPNANITREEAMAMLQRAAKVAEFAGTTGTLTGFTDAGRVSAWARTSAAFSVGSGLIAGDGGLIRPQDNITRAESAAVILRLLQKSGLVDIRSKT